MVKKIGLYTGSFDPVTLGHLDLIERARHLFDELIVGIFYNPNKVSFLDIATRESLLKESLGAWSNVRVIVSQGELVVDVAKRHQVTSLVRGLRGSQDLAYEASFDFYNHELAPDLDTLYLLARPAYQFVSSSGVRELYAFQSDVAKYVPENVVKELEKKRGSEKN